MKFLTLTSIASSNLTTLNPPLGRCTLRVFLSLSGLATLADKLGDDGAGAGEGGAAGGVPGRAPSGELILPVPSFLQKKKKNVRFKRFRTQEYKNIEECKKLMAIFSLGPVGHSENLQLHLRVMRKARCCF
jgi:hypothetical protein